ncbi:ketoacyl-ACP synthase III [candidate division KSB1 bacterium]|nr:ketoacyl-ACP synthase III [candidate division KSB1 bacterium]RQW00284.1 MAG: ketoacyl-ACP synthase III [candidate division KSB1 bacterium]
MSSDFQFPAYKKRSIRRFCKIIATGSYVPERIVTNQEIIDANKLSVTDAVIRKSIGVEERRAVAAGVTDSDVLVEAAKRCLERAGLQPDDVSKMLVNKFLGDNILPMTAAQVQKKLGSQLAFHAVDIEGGINAFLTSLDLATRYISTTGDAAQNILILSGGAPSVAVGKTDPRVAFLFGDGAGAVLLAPSTEAHFLASYLYTNYQYYDVATSRKLKMDSTLSDKIYEEQQYSLLYNLYQMDNWKEVADFYVQAARTTSDFLLAESGLSMTDIDLVLVTENNRKIRDLTLEALGVPEEKSLSVFREYGNTMSAMLPILLDKAFREQRVQEGQTIMLISHGEGASGGGIIYKV